MRAKNTIGQIRKCMHVKGLFKHAVYVCESSCAYLYQGYIPYGQGYSASRVSSRSIKERRTFTLGMSHSFAPSMYDNFSNMTLGFQIMADKNPCVDQQIRSSLLTYILTNELRRRFISSRSKDKVVYCANEAMKYIAIYVDYISRMVILIHIRSGMPVRLFFSCGQC